MEHGATGTLVLGQDLVLDGICWMIEREGGFQASQSMDAEVVNDQTQPARNPTFRNIVEFP